MIFIQSKGQLLSKRQHFSYETVYTRNKDLLIHKDVKWIKFPNLIFKIIFYKKKIIMGDVRSSYSLIRRLINSKQTFFLSDGLGTEVAKKAFKERRSLYFSITGLSTHLKLLDLITKSDPNFLEPIKNSWNIKNNDKVYFIGQPLSENKIVDRNDEVDAISKSGASFYVVHPKESNIKIKLIKDLNKLELIYAKVPAEEYLEEKGFKKLIGFSSSVLFNFRQYNIEVIDIDYKENYLGIDCRIAQEIIKSNV